MDETVTGGASLLDVKTAKTEKEYVKEFYEYLMDAKKNRKESELRRYVMRYKPVKGQKDPGKKIRSMVKRDIDISLSAKTPFKSLVHQITALFQTNFDYGDGFYSKAAKFYAKKIEAYPISETPEVSHSDLQKAITNLGNFYEFDASKKLIDYLNKAEGAPQPKPAPRPAPGGNDQKTVQDVLGMITIQDYIKPLTDVLITNIPGESVTFTLRDCPKFSIKQTKRPRIHVIYHAMEIGYLKPMSSLLNPLKKKRKVLSENEKKMLWFYSLVEHVKNNHNDYLTDFLSDLTLKNMEGSIPALRENNNIIRDEFDILPIPGEVPSENHIFKIARGTEGEAVGEAPYLEHFKEFDLSGTPTPTTNLEAKNAMWRLILGTGTTGGGQTGGAGADVFIKILEEFANDVEKRQYTTITKKYKIRSLIFHPDKNRGEGTVGPEIATHAFQMLTVVDDLVEAEKYSKVSETARKFLSLIAEALYKDGTFEHGAQFLGNYRLQKDSPTPVQKPYNLYSSKYQYDPGEKDGETIPTLLKRVKSHVGYYNNRISVEDPNRAEALRLYHEFESFMLGSLLETSNKLLTEKFTNQNLVQLLCHAHYTFAMLATMKGFDETYGKLAVTENPVSNFYVRIYDYARKIIIAGLVSLPPSEATVGSIMEIENLRARAQGYYGGTPPAPAETAHNNAKILGQVLSERKKNGDLSPAELDTLVSAYLINRKNKNDFSNIISYVTIKDISGFTDDPKMNTLRNAVIESCLKVWTSGTVDPLQKLISKFKNINVLGYISPACEKTAKFVQGEYGDKKSSLYYFAYVNDFHTKVETTHGIKLGSVDPRKEPASVIGIAQALAVHAKYPDEMRTYRNTNQNLRENINKIKIELRKVQALGKQQNGREQENHDPKAFLKVKENILNEILQWRQRQQREQREREEQQQQQKQKQQQQQQQQQQKQQQQQQQKQKQQQQQQQQQQKQKQQQPKFKPQVIGEGGFGKVFYLPGEMIKDSQYCDSKSTGIIAKYIKDSEARKAELETNEMFHKAFEGEEGEEQYTVFNKCSFKFQRLLNDLYIGGSRLTAKHALILYDTLDPPQDLSQYVKRYMLQTEDLNHLYLTLTRFVEKAAKKHLYHNDIKLLNIIVRKGNGVPEYRIIDYGLSGKNSQIGTPCFHSLLDVQYDKLYRGFLKSFKPTFKVSSILNEIRSNDLLPESRNRSDVTKKRWEYFAIATTFYDIYISQNNQPALDYCIKTLNELQNII